jgi:hypothetical protein
MNDTEKALEKIRQARLAYYAEAAQQESEPIVEEPASLIERLQQLVEDQSK